MVWTVTCAISSTGEVPMFRSNSGFPGVTNSTLACRQRADGDPCLVVQRQVIARLRPSGGARPQGATQIGMPVRGFRQGRSYTARHRPDRGCRSAVVPPRWKPAPCRSSAIGRTPATGPGLRLVPANVHGHDPHVGRLGRADRPVFGVQVAQGESGRIIELAVAVEEQPRRQGFGHLDIGRIGARAARVGQPGSDLERSKRDVVRWVGSMASTARRSRPAFSVRLCFTSVLRH